ncbi:MAG: acyl carrier protein [Sandaracinaceae bacterium]|nr:acyl carrier protein [Sandaracinaceae bacterium]MDW8245535.1 acyl carrier protein [Sandaracinaceae bacterium]
MKHEAITERLLELAARRFGCSRELLRPEQDFFEALDIDSVEAMRLLSALESEFGVEIPDYEVQDVRTFAGLAEVISRRVKHA